MLFLTDPVDVFVNFYGGVIWVDQDYFKPFRDSIFSYPVGIQDFEVRELSGYSFFTN